MTSLRIPISQVDLLIAQGASRKQMQRVCIVVTHEPCRAWWRWRLCVGPMGDLPGITRFTSHVFGLQLVTKGYKTPFLCSENLSSSQYFVLNRLISMLFWVDSLPRIYIYIHDIANILYPPKMIVFAPLLVKGDTPTNYIPLNLSSLYQEMPQQCRSDAAAKDIYIYIDIDIYIYI